MPKKLNVFESRMRDLLKKYATRGKIDIFINYEDDSESQVNLKFNQNIADEYMAIFNNMSEKYNLKNVLQELAEEYINENLYKNEEKEV